MDNENFTPKDNWKRITCILFALLLICNAVIFVLALGIRAQLDEHNKIKIILPPDLKTEIAGTFKQAANDIKSEVQKTAEKTATQIIADTEKKNINALGKIDKQLAQIIAAQNQLRPELANLNGNIESVVQAAKKNHTNAEMAIAMAKKAAEQGELQLAMVYALNAINHESSNIAYIKFYNDLLVQKQDLAISDIDQFVNVLDLAVFQVAASDVSDVISIKTAMVEKRSSIVSAEAEARNREVATAVAASIAELKNGRLAISRVYSQGSVNEYLLKERVEALTSLLADASLSQDDRKKFTEELSYATGLYSIATTTSAAKNSIAKANVLADRKQLNATEILTARNQLQTANTLLAQIWSSDCSKYQDFVAIAEQLQGEISSIDRKLNVIASAPAKKKIENLIAKCRSIVYEDGKYTSRINQITEISKEFPQLLSSIYDLDLRKTLASEIESLSPLVSKLSQDRYKAYQKWAVEKLNAARKKWDSYNVVTDKRAQNMFNDYILEINPALLLPDVNSLYNNIYQLIYNELPNKAWMQYRKATYDNVKQLEDF